MSWLYLTPTTVQRRGAGSTHVLGFCGALARRTPVTLVAPISPAVRLPAGVRGVPVPMPRRLRSLAYELQVLRMALAGRCWPRPDLIYVRSGTFNFGALLYARALGVPCVLEVNGDLCDEIATNAPATTPAARLRQAAAMAVYGRSLRWSYAAATGLIVVTGELVGLLAERYGADPRRVRVVGNGVDVLRFLPLQTRVCRQRLGLPTARRLVGYIGSMAGWQDLPTLLHGFARVKDRFADVDLLVVGDGEQRAAVAALIAQLGLAERTHLRGSVPHDDVPLYLNACDIATVPKRNLASGYSALKGYEAMGCGRPILASDQRSNQFLGEVGVLYRAEDPADFAEQLAGMLTRPAAELHAMGLAARRAAEERFSWAATVAQVRAGIAELTGRHV